MGIGTNVSKIWVLSLSFSLQEILPKEIMLLTGCTRSHHWKDFRAYLFSHPQCLIKHAGITEADLLKSTDLFYGITEMAFWWKEGRIHENVPGHCCLKYLAALWQDDSCPQKELLPTALPIPLFFRVHCFHYLIPLAKEGNYAIVANVESMDYDPLVVKLNKDISAIEEAMSASLQQHKFQYIFEGQTLALALGVWEEGRVKVSLISSIAEVQNL